MPPRRKPANNRVLCTCVTHKCGTKRYWLDGAWHRGHLVVSSVRHRHQIDDQAECEEQAPPDRNIQERSSSSSPSPNPSEHQQNSDQERELAPAESEEAVRDVGEDEDARRDTALAAVAQCLSLTDRITPVDSPREYDTSRWTTSPFECAPPVFTYGILVATMFSVLQPTSNHTSAWLLRSQRDLIELTLRNDLGVGSAPRSLTTTEQLTLDKLPDDTRSSIKWLKLDPTLLQLNCCPKCFATYPLDRTPTKCFNFDDNVIEDPSDDAPDTCDCSDPREKPQVCGQPLFRLYRSVTKPFRRFTYQCLDSWIARLLTRPGIEDSLDQSLTGTFAPSKLKDSGRVSDIHDSMIWSEFKGPDGKPFTAQSGNLVFGFFLDAINPYGNKQSGKHASITFMVLVCMSFPYHMRFLPENLFLVGIAPGPKEPSLTQTNWILKPMVHQLKNLWTSGLSLSSTHRHPEGRHIRAALIPCFADLPALRRALGFPGHSANKFMCTFCDTSKSQINNLDVKSWTPRTSEYHIKWAHAFRDAETPKERARILKLHGVRYSVLTELPYWKPNEYQTVDAMHNLLLGLLKWHCMRFWGMSDKAVNEDYRFGNSHVPNTEVRALEEEEASNDATRYETRSNRSSSSKDDESDESDESASSRGVPFLEQHFGTNTHTSDTNWELNDTSNSGWGGRWTAGSSEDNIFDSVMLQIINSLLPRIRYPTWIKRAIPMLGKASNGKLKADEWRNLFLLQLPLVMVKIWYGRNRVDMSLLHNFAHLVSAVNLALKRFTTPSRITSYSHHIHEYLSSSIVLFPGTSLAPNHHMAMHLTECLQRFGPVRAWWSFPMERLMGQVLKSSHNNRLGQLETTFLKGFCRAGNLRVLLDQPNLFPKALHPYINQLKHLYEPRLFSPKYLAHPLRSDTLTSTDCQKLVDYLNTKSNDQRWAVSSDWSCLNAAEKKKKKPLPSRCQLHNHFTHKNVSFSTWAANPDNSVISVDEAFPKQLNFARIEAIFTHSRKPTSEEQITETWLKIKPFPPFPPTDRNIFSELKQPHLHLYLRLPASNDEYIINIQDVVAHCAWIEYNANELNTTIKYPTVGLVSLDRD